jgi:hypothetical protein
MDNLLEALLMCGPEWRPTRQMWERQGLLEGLENQG